MKGVTLFCGELCDVSGELCPALAVKFDQRMRSLPERGVGTREIERGKIKEMEINVFGEMVEKIAIESGKRRDAEERDSSRK
jgi:hypothetical protein